MAKTFRCDPDYPVVQTKAGKIRGFLYDDVFTFQGIRYGVAKRFQMPEPVEPWEGIKDALAYGYDCVWEGFPREMPAENIMLPNQCWPQSEHCQYLNVWTDTLDPNAKKAVMVFLHGGGYSVGSSINLEPYPGDGMAKNDDVVVVSLNHRLNVFGFLDVSEYGEEYKNSKDASLADMVLALEWVRDNIQNFGGDPNNVTIYGQSGGGGKVSALAQSPAADGLYHKAIIMSGVIHDKDPNDPSAATNAEFLDALFAELDLKRNEFERFLEVPDFVLIRAVRRAEAKLAEAGKSFGWAPIPGDYYPGDLPHKGVSEYFKNIPVMIGSCFAEFQMDNGLSEDPKYLELFADAYPTVPMKYAHLMDTFFRKNTLNYAKQRAKEADAPTFLYMFAQELTVFGGMMSGHGADLPYFWHHAEDCPAANIGPDTDKLEAIMAGAFTSFAKNGTPDTEGLPSWAPCTPEHVNSMLLSAEPELYTDREEAVMAYVDEHGEKRRFRDTPKYEEAVKWPY